MCALPSSKDSFTFYTTKGKFEMIVDMLISECGGLNKGDNLGRSPLHYAVMYSDIAMFFESIEILLDAGADTDIQDFQGQTPLHIAAKKGFLEALEKLLERHPKLDIQDQQGRTALHLACLNVHLRAVYCLLNAGARSDIKDEEGKTMLFILLPTYQAHLLNLSQKILCDENDCPIICNIVKKVDEYIDINDEKETAAHLVVSLFSHDIELQKIVIERQKDLNIKSAHGYTPLGYAVQRYNHETGATTIKLLVQNGAYLTKSDYRWITEKPMLRDKLFTDVKFCAQAVLNWFNVKELPHLYTIIKPTTQLPPIDKMKLKITSNAFRCIEDDVRMNINRFKLFNISKLACTSLMMLSVKAYLLTENPPDQYQGNMGDLLGLLQRLGFAFH